MFTGLKKNIAVFALSALGAGVVAIACSGGGGGGNSGGSGGDSGGAGGDSGGSGSGGSGSGGKGSGGSGNGGSGSGGSGSGGSGSGGSSAGGSGGGMPMTGGMGMGGGMVSAGAPKWCTSATERPATNDGTQMLTGGPAINPPEPNNPNAPMGTTKMIGGGMVYIPAQYDAAKSGEVGLLALLSSYNLDAATMRKFDQVIAAGEMPPVIVGKSPDGGGNANAVLAFVKAIKDAYPKITNPKMVATAGQSTAGAQAFDIAWANPTQVGAVIAASGSFVCFMGNAPYDDLISGAGKKDIRVSMAVGTCDIFGSLGDRLAAGCSNCSGAECVDASACAASWLPANKGVAAALKAKGNDHQLLIMEKIGHLVMNPTGLLNQMRWLYRPLTCK
jgi:hypothetical protein